MANLESARERFLNQLHTAEFDPSSHMDFLAYWNNIEAQATVVDDLGRLDGWYKEIQRDKDRISELRARQQSASSSQFSSADSVKLLNRILLLLDDIGHKIRKRLMMLRDQLGMWVFLAGPGRKSKPNPQTDKEKTKDEETKEQLLAKKQEKKEPSKKMER